MSSEGEKKTQKTQTKKIKKTSHQIFSKLSYNTMKKTTTKAHICMLIKLKEKYE